MSVNKVILLGHVGGDPELRFPEKDVAVAYFSLATNERYCSSQTEITEWHNIVMWDRHAETAECIWKGGFARANTPTVSR